MNSELLEEMSLMVPANRNVSEHAGQVPAAVVSHSLQPQPLTAKKAPSQCTIHTTATKDQTERPAGQAAVPGA